MRQVLSNLLGNALQHTTSGGVTINGALQANNVVLRVADTGAGIAADQLPYIFERLRKSDDSRGSGLGLAIAKSLVEAHGGRISAESEVGRGTTIIVELPVGAE
jgi:signal transduction histidine kinase